MRAYPRPGRVLQRLGNVIADVSGEIDLSQINRASTERGMGVLKLGLWTYVLDEQSVRLVTEHRQR